MPYIKPEDRTEYDELIDSLVDKLLVVFTETPERIKGDKAGHLNYIITTLLTRFYRRLQARLFGTYTLKYSDHNEIIGVLECIKQEFYRRQTAPYENEKIKENGDVSY